MSKPDPMAVQVGGNHYKKFAIQPTEFCMRNMLDPCIHGVIKYLARWRDKGGVEDLKKAVHYIQIRENFPNDLVVRPIAVSMVEFVNKNSIALSEAEVLYRLESYYMSQSPVSRAEGARRAIDAIEAIIRAEEIKTA